MAEKLQEARSLIAEASKAENKTSFFGKKKPDWETALTNYEAAANIFKGSKAYQEAADALMKVADCHKNLDSLFMAAKALEGAAHITHQQLNQLSLAAHGSADRAADTLEKAAKAWDTVDSTKALEGYSEALNLIESEDRPRSGIDTFKRAISYAAKCAAWDVGIGFAKRLIELYIKLDQKHFLNKTILTSIILGLRKDDISLASNLLQTYSSVNNFSESEEGKVAVMMIEAVEEGNADLMQSATQSSAVRFLENEIARVAISIKLHAKKEGAQFEKNTAPQDLQDAIEDEGFL